RSAASATAAACTQARRPARPRRVPCRRPGLGGAGGPRLDPASGSLQREVRAAVLRPRSLVIAGIERALPAVRDDLDSRRRDARLHQVVPGGLRAPLAQRLVVLDGAALVAVALDDEFRRL